MANSREALFQWNITKAMPAGGWEYVSWLELRHYRFTKCGEKYMCLEEAEGEYGLTSVSEVGSGKPHDPEKQRLADIIDRLNELYGAEVSDDDKLHFAKGYRTRRSGDSPGPSTQRRPGDVRPTRYSAPSATTRSSACRCWRMKRQAGSSRC